VGVRLVDYGLKKKGIVGWNLGDQKSRQQLNGNNQQQNGGENKIDFS